MPYRHKECGGRVRPVYGSIDGSRPYTPAYITQCDKCGATRIFKSMLERWDE